MNQNKISQAAEQVGYTIVRSYSTDPRLAMIGYWIEKKEAPKVHHIMDAIITPDKPTIVGIDRRQGPVQSKKVLKRLRPFVSKHIEQPGVEIQGIDSDQLRALTDLTELEPDDIAEKRLYQAIIPNILRIYQENLDHNIITLLKFDLSLEHLALYRELEQKQVPYLTIFPVEPWFLRKDKDNKPYTQRLEELAKTRFD